MNEGNSFRVAGLTLIGLLLAMPAAMARASCPNA